MKKILFTLSFLFLMLSTAMYGQGWERTYGGTGLELGYDVLQTANGDFISCGYSTSFGNGTDQVIYIVRTDIDGDTVWTKTHEMEDARLYGQSLIETTDGNYLIAGYILETSADENFFLLKIDPDGEMLWESSIAGPGEDIAFQVIETVDGGFAIIGETKDLSTDQKDMYLIRTNANGAELWNRRIGGIGFDVAYSIVETPSNHFLIAGYQTDVTPTDTTREAVVIETDAMGLVLDTISLGETVLVSDAEIVPTMDGGYTVAVYNGNVIEDNLVVLKKLDANLDIQWSKGIADIRIIPGPSMLQTPDGGYALTGSFRAPGRDEDDLRIVKTDSQGDIVWSKSYGSPINNDVGLGICNASGAGFGVIGYTRSFGAGLFDYYLLKTDSLGYTLNNTILGNVLYDLNDDCIIDAGEYGLSNWLLEASSNTNIYYGLTDEDGNYQISVDTGTYTLKLISLNEYWQSCGNNYVLSLLSPYEADTVDFPLQSVYDCPLLEVDISTPFLRRCFENRYTVNYCNEGTILAEDAQVEVTLDEYLIFQDASNTNFTNDGNIYTFDVGDIDVDECGTFYIDVLVDCDSTLLGQTHCVEAHITPDSICTPPLACWDGGSIELDATCIGDSVQFTVKNVGVAPIDLSLGYIIAEDHVILHQRPFEGDIQPQGFEVITQPVNGGTIRIEVDQPPCHPGNSRPAISVEGCGLVDDSQVSLGYITQYFEDDSNPFVSIDCQENVGSWDPNDKRGFPKGYKEEHYIEANTELDYHIRFQNTGSDTAFRVVIRDTISKWLDVHNIRAGASSHPYKFEIYDRNIVKFTFENINLPDSLTDETGSHGFVKFRVAQKTGLELGTKIHNSAGIYFDFNAPIITNETLHTLGENLISVSITSIPNQLAEVKIYPNPFNDFATIDIRELAIDNGQFKLYDATGRLVRNRAFSSNTYRLAKQELLTGLYFFTIENNGEIIANGKLIAE